MQPVAAVGEAGFGVRLRDCTAQEDALSPVLTGLFWPNRPELIQHDRAIALRLIAELLEQ